MEYQGKVSICSLKPMATPDHCFFHLVCGGDGSVTAHRENVPILFIDSVEVHWMLIPVLFNEFPMDGQLGFQPFAITNNAEMYILDSPEKVIEMELLSQRIFTI